MIFGKILFRQVRRPGTNEYETHIVGKWPRHLQMAIELLAADYVEIDNGCIKFTMANGTATYKLMSGKQDPTVFNLERVEYTHVDQPRR